MTLTKEEIGKAINDLEEQEKFAWAELNKVLGAKEVYIAMWNRIEAEEAAQDKLAEKYPEKGD